jgi:hypothetical protein
MFYYCEGHNINVTNNRCYGVALWGAFAGDPGPTGTGNAIVTNSPIDGNYLNAPKPPVNTFAGPNFMNGSNPTPASSSSSAPSSSSSASSASQIAGLSVTYRRASPAASLVH